MAVLPGTGSCTRAEPARGRVGAVSAHVPGCGPGAGESPITVSRVHGYGDFFHCNVTRDPEAPASVWRLPPRGSRMLALVPCFPLRVQSCRAEIGPCLSTGPCPPKASCPEPLFLIPFVSPSYCGPRLRAASDLGAKLGNSLEPKFSQPQTGSERHLPWVA